MKFDKLSLQLIFITPHCDLIYQLLWKRLPVGGRQRAWRPEHAACPLDGAQDTIQHTITCYKLPPAAFNTINKCFPEADPQTHVGSATLIDHHPSQSLVTAQGGLAWCAIVDTRCKSDCPGFRHCSEVRFLEGASPISTQAMLLTCAKSVNCAG